MAGKQVEVREDFAEADITMWQEALCAVEVLLLRAAPVYWGLGAPHGDGSAVIIIPGFLGTDLYLMEMYAWLRRMGYRSYFSGIGLNAECPNLLIRTRLNQTMDRALAETGGRKVHLIGHSLGGVIARSMAGERSSQVASVITLGSPFRGTVVHRNVLKAATIVREKILRQHGRNVLPECYTGACTCNFLERLRRELPAGLLETAIFTRSDGIVDWHYCITGDSSIDFEVPGTHIGLAFNPVVYSIIAKRLSEAKSSYSGSLHSKVAASKRPALSARRGSSAGSPI